VIRTARGQSERGEARVRLDRSQKTPSNQLIQPGRSNICERSSPPHRLKMTTAAVERVPGQDHRRAAAIAGRGGCSAALGRNPPSGAADPWRQPRVGKSSTRCRFASARRPGAGVTAHSRRRACRLGARSGDRPGPESEAAHGKLQEAAGAGSTAGPATAQ
jgi:hypothetical protein